MSNDRYGIWNGDKFLVDAEGYKLSLIKSSAKNIRDLFTKNGSMGLTIINLNDPPACAYCDTDICPGEKWRWLSGAHYRAAHTACYTKAHN